MMKSYVVLGTELFKGHMNDGTGQNELIPRRREKSNNIAQMRRGVSQPIDDPKLAECQLIIERGLSHDPTNDSLLKLQGELRLVNEYGSNGAQTKMIRIGRFDFMEK